MLSNCSLILSVCFLIFLFSFLQYFWIASSLPYIPNPTLLFLYIYALIPRQFYRTMWPTLSSSPVSFLRCEYFSLFLLSLPHSRCVNWHSHNLLRFFSVFVCPITLQSNICCAYFRGISQITPISYGSPVGFNLKNSY